MEREVGKSMYHVSIYFDKKTEIRIRDYMRKIAEATGNAYMLEAAVPPHITLSALECEKEEVLVKRLEAFITGKAEPVTEDMSPTDKKARANNASLSAMQAGTLTWVSVGTFFPGVIFLQPVLNEYLQGLAQQVYLSVKDVEGVKVRPCYKPFSWLPHSTVAKKLTPTQLQQAFQVMQQEFAVFEGSVVCIGLAKMNPHREIASWELKNALSGNSPGLGDFENRCKEPAV